MNRRSMFRFYRYAVQAVAGLVMVGLGATGCSADGGKNAGGTGGSAATGSSSTGGAGIGGMGSGYCTQPSDCPGEDTACQKRACEWNQCSMDPLPPYAATDMQIAGDCRKNVCDGAGNVVIQNDDTDPFDDLNDCTMDKCNAGHAENIPLAAGASCTSNGGKLCDGKGACVECLSSLDCGSDLCDQTKCVPASCADGEKNGDETGQDCGGVACAPCAAGAPCKAGSDCMSSVCKTGFCAAPSCVDSTKNGSESDVDCGGTCLPCTSGSGCEIAADCESLVCSMSLCQPPACGDGVKQGAEACDDGNTTPGDGCDASCTVEPGHQCTDSPSTCLPIETETEPNASCGAANGAYALPALFQGALDPEEDEDIVAFTVPAYADVRIETFAPVQGECVSASTRITLRDRDCNVLGTDDLDGSDGCSLLSGSTHVAARHLAPDTYHVSVKHGSTVPTVIPQYQLVMTFTALCGNGIQEGSEECDTGGPSPTCDAQCQRVPVCGDGLWDAPEPCEDGNTLDGDCCSSTCQVEAGCTPVETEPNNTCASGNGPFDPPFDFTGALDPFGDEDIVAFTVPAYADVEIETFDPTVGQCIAADTVVELRDPDCKLQARDDDDGLGYCSSITTLTDGGAKHLAPGIYHARIRHYNYGILPKYQLQVRFTALCGDGILEGSEDCDGTMGCSAACTPCGDGVLQPSETCDDQNLIDGDGCAATCAAEPGFVCDGSPSVCAVAETICNDGIDNDGDGQTDNADANCTLPAYFPGCAPDEVLRVFKSSSSLAIPIPSGDPVGASHTLNIPDAAVIGRAALLFNALYPQPMFIKIQLTPPGMSSLMVLAVGGFVGENYVDTMFDPKCTANLGNGAGPFSNCYRPWDADAIASLAGTTTRGMWTITATDQFDFPWGISGGTLQNWALILCTSP